MFRIQLIDLLSRKTVAAHYALLRESQWWPRERVELLQIAKLRGLLRHCARHVPFYRDVMSRQGIVPERIGSLDVLQAFPIIDKTAVKANPDAFRTVGSPDLGLVRYSQTGGTTGEPLRVPKDAAARSAAQAAMLRFHDWMGIAPGDRKLVLWGAPIIRQSRQRRLREGLLRAVLNTRQVDAFRLTPVALPQVADLLASWQPRLVHGYCRSLLDLARWINDSDRVHAVRAVSTTVEPLFVDDRPTLRHAFQCDAYDQYGCGEVESVAMECPAHHGLHVTEERVVLELAPDGAVILTDLDNRALPFIRYRNGDLAEAADGSCPCGREAKRLRRILGRTGDVVSGVSGQRVHPEFFTHLLNETGIAMRRALRRYQVVQDSAGAISWKLASAPLEPEEIELLVAAVRRYLGAVPIEIVQVDDIPVEASGKYRYVLTPGA